MPGSGRLDLGHAMVMVDRPYPFQEWEMEGLTSAWHGRILEGRKRDSLIILPLLVPHQACQDG